MHDAPSPPDKVLRFRASERRLHWSIAIPFLTCYATALVLVVLYNPNPLQPHREVLSWAHRISGLALITLPVVAVARGGRDLRVHFYNVRQAWIWVLSDLKWLALMGLAMVSKRVRLPEQGKFNAAQKLNFMMVMATYPLYVLTGVTMWVTGAPLLAWLVHFGMALIATPFLMGHIFMATVAPDTRVALHGMFSGFVDRQWAKHHHARWYQEHYGTAEGTDSPGERPTVAPAAPDPVAPEGPPDIDRTRAEVLREVSVVRLSSGVAVVTGASSQFGRAVALRLARRGVLVALVGGSGAALGEVATAVRGFGGEALVFPCDPADGPAITSALERIITELGNPDVVVKASGTPHVVDRRDSGQRLAL